MRVGTSKASIGGSGGEQNQPQHTSAMLELVDSFKETGDGTAVRGPMLLPRSHRLASQHHMALTTVTLVPGNPTLLTSSGTGHIHGTHMYTCRQTLTKIKQSFKKEGPRDGSG